jgi:hypothetical protein
MDALCTSILKGSRNDPNHISIWENDSQPFDLTEMRSDPLLCKRKKKKKEKEKRKTRVRVGQPRSYIQSGQDLDSGSGFSQ